MADRLGENGAIKFAQESTAAVGTVSRLGGAGQIEADIRRLVAEGFYTTKVAAYTARGRLINAALDAFSPLFLFANNEVGTWFAPSDISTLFQDQAGTTPVTAVEQPVGLMLDKSKGGGAIGTNTVVNGTFDADTDWTKGTGWSIGLGVATKIAGTASVLSQAVTLTAGRYYIVTYTITRTAGTLTMQFTGGTTVSGTARSAAGTYTDILTAVSGNTTLEFSAGATFVGTVDNVTLREMPAGNYAYTPAAASTARPTLSARYNLLLSTATLATQNVTVTAGTHTLYFTGTGSIDLSGTGSGTFNAGTHTITTTAGTLTLTVTGSVLTADLRRANDGVGLPVYQSVVTATDYDTVNFPPYLRFDGSNDYMLTNSIDFTATDKMTVFAGVRKLSDAALGMLTELSTNWVNNVGTFSIQSPAFVITNRYGFTSRGSGLAQAFTSSDSYTAPITNVLTAIGSISTDECILRANTSQVALSTSDQGSGNYGNYPLYIGMRAGTSLPFNGRLYSLITRGVQSTTSEIANTEQWVNSKTKAYGI